MKSGYMRQSCKLAIAGMVMFLVLSVMTRDGKASRNEQTVPTAPPPTVPLPSSTPAVKTPTRMPTSLTQPTQAATTQAVESSPTALDIGTSPTSFRISSEVPGGGTIPLVSATAEPMLKTQTLTDTPGGTTSTVIPGSAGGGIRGGGTVLLGLGVILLVALVIVWWVRSRRTDTPE